MQILNRLLFASVVAISSLLFFSVQISYAQICGGGGTCVELGMEQGCEDSGAVCDGTSDCNKLTGERCVITNRYANSVPGECRYNGRICNSACAYAPGWESLSCGTPYYPPVVTPRPTVPAPAPICVGAACDQCQGECCNQSCEPEEPPPPPDLYTCDNCGGCVASPTGNSEYSACSASCIVYPAGSAECPDPPTPAGASSCQDLQDTATEDITYPGQTRTWSTWAPPPGGSASERLNNASPLGMITRSYSSPGDKLTISYIWQEIEGQSHSFYIFDDRDNTFYFYQGPDKPPVIFARKQAVVDNAKKIGYTQITDVGNNDASANAAMAYEKRVYKLPDDDGSGDIHPWRDGNGPAFVKHAPWGKSHYTIPFANCASIFNASGHHRYYSTNINALQNDRGFCYRRQQLIHNNQSVRWWNPDTETDISHVSGNYLGLEKDLAEARAGDPEYSHIFGRDNSGDPRWPVTNILSGPRWEYFDNFAYAFMETKGQYLARPGSNNTNFTPAYIRNAVLQIPIDAFDAQGEHDLYVFLGMGGIPSSEVPVEDHHTSACMLSQDFNAETVIKTDPEVTDPFCANFEVYDSQGVPTNEIQLGQQYEVKANAFLESQIYTFYNASFNQGFNATDRSPGDVVDWTKTGGIMFFKSVWCSDDEEPCYQGATDNRMLAITELNNGSESYVSTPYIETATNITGKTFTVSFWAKADTTVPLTISKMTLQRLPYVSTVAPYDEKVDNTLDIQNLKFMGETADPDAVTTSFKVTNGWKRYTGTVTFPSTHPYDSDTTKVKLRIFASSAVSSDVYYDDFVITGSHKPTVDYRLVRKDQKCTFLSIVSDSTTYNSAGQFTGLFNMDPTYPGSRYADLQPGEYYIFARMETPSGDKIYFGNPNAVADCGITDPKWDDSIAATCTKTVNLTTCNENDPPTPSFAPAAVSGGGQGLSYVKGSTSSVSYMPYGGASPQITQMPVQRVAATNTYRLPIVVTIPTNQADDVTAIEYQLFKMDHNGASLGAVGSRVTIPNDSAESNFEFDIVPSKELTNQFIIRVQAINGNSCSEESGIISSTLEGRIFLMGTASGAVIDIPKEDADNFTCQEQYPSADLTSKSSTAGIAEGLAAQLVALGESDITGDNYIDFLTPPFANLSSGTLSTFFIPFNPDNTGGSTGWKNRIRSAELRLPVPSSQDAYLCLDCNQKSETEKHICTFPASEAASGFKTDKTFSQTNFFISRGNFVFDSWWQSRGGLVASIGRMESLIPIFNGEVSFNCREDQEAFCQPFLNAKAMGIAGDYTTSDPSAGVPFTNSDTLEARTYVTQRDDQSQAKSANATPITEDYDHFRKLFKNTVTSYDTSKVWALQDFVSAEYTSEGDTDMFVLSTEDSSSPNLDLNLLAPIGVTTGTKIIVFVEGNLNITGPSDTTLTNVANGAFLMFIVQGDITVDANIGHSLDNKETRTASALEGVFLANDDIIIESKGSTATIGPADNKFVAEGSFVALNRTADSSNGIELPRHFDDLNNSLAREKNSYSPVEMFIFRPDFVVNAPKIINRPSLTWEEAN